MINTTLQSGEGRTGEESKAALQYQSRPPATVGPSSRIVADCGESPKKKSLKKHTHTHTKKKLGVVVGKNRNGVFNEAAVLGVGVGVG